MKNVLKLTAAFTLTFLSNLSATPVIEPKIECKNSSCQTFKIGMYRVKDTETMNLLIEKDKGQRLEIRIMDNKGKVLHTEYVAGSMKKFGTKLNFSELNDGTYTVEISNNNEKIVKSIFLSTNEIQEVNRLLLGVN